MQRRLGWLACMAMAGLLMAAADSFARQGIVRLRDGKTLEGDLEEKPDQVIVTIRGIKTRVDRDNVAAVEYFDNIEARYKDRLAKLPKSPTVKDRLDLARWLFDVKAYDLALAEVDASRKIDPNSAEAATLEQTILSQRRLERSRPQGIETAPTPAAPKQPGAEKTPPADRKFLTPEDINTIRQMEWKENDRVAPRVTVPADVRKRYVDYKAEDPGLFASLSQPAQAYLILTKGTPEMRKDIKITSDPAMLTVFRRVIQPLVVNNCATTACHGGHHAGRFFLYNSNNERDEVAYTNFYILRKYKQKFGDRLYSMIDPQYENLSILGQFSLHPDVAELDHPEIKGQAYHPIAANKNAPAYRTIAGWMKELSAGDPDYGIRFELPVSSAPGAPATTPAGTRPADAATPKIPPAAPAGAKPPAAATK